MHNNINVNVSGPQQPASTYKTFVLKGQVPFATQVTEPNMKYVIKHDFDLGGETITVPENCVLEFDGGSLSNGTLVGNFTVINAALAEIFKSTLTLSGTWNCAEVYPEWFGAKASGNIDCADAIEKALNFSVYDGGEGYPLYSSPVKLHGEYKVSHTITLPFHTFLIGTNPRLSGLMAMEGFEGDFVLQTLENTTAPNSREGFERLSVDGQGYASGIRIFGANELFICKNIEVLRYKTYGVYITELNRIDEPGRKTATQNCIFEDLAIQTPTQEESYGLYLNVCIDCIFIRTTIDAANSSEIGTKYGIYGVNCNNNTFLKLNLEDCKHPIYLSSNNAYNFTIRDFLCKNPACDLAPYDDEKIAVIRTQTTKGFTVEGYKFYANDVYQDMEGNPVPDADKYKRYDLYVNNGADIILPATVSNNIKVGSFKISGSMSIVDLEGESVVIGPSFIWDASKTIDEIKGLRVTGDFVSRKAEGNVIEKKGQIAFIDNYNNVPLNELCYHDGNSIYKIKGISVNDKFGGNTSEKPEGNTRYEFQQFFDVQVDKQLLFVGGRWVDAFGFSSAIKNGNTTLRNNLITNNKFVNDDAGFMYYDTSIQKPIWLKVVNTGTSESPVYVFSWIEADGVSVDERRSGTYAQRPTYDKIPTGFKYLITTNTPHVRIPIFYGGANSNDDWYYSDGAKYGIKRSGTKAERPVGSDIYVGFQYMQVDTTYGTYPIWASAISGDTVTWVKADGTDPDA